jgi:hypothetical protein
MGACQHQSDSYNALRDACWLVLIFVGVLILREVFSWFFKTNHIRSNVLDNQHLLRGIIQRMDRNGLR